MSPVIWFVGVFIAWIIIGEFIQLCIGVVEGIILELRGM
jgi:hypothetical protein